MNVLPDIVPALRGEMKAPRGERASPKIVKIFSVRGSFVTGALVPDSNCTEKARLGNQDI